MANIANFSFNSTAVRTFDDNGNPWFSAKDVCNILGYKNDSDAIAKHCKPKGVAKRDTLTDGGNQALSFINEGNLYRLIVKSRKPEAEKFEAWVMEEVLPTIRKTGAYTLTINPAQQRAIQEFVNLKVRTDNTTHQTVYHDLKTRFSVGKYDQLPSARFDECIKWLEGYAPQIAAPSSPNFLADFPRQIEAGNGYPDEVLKPILTSICQRMGLVALNRDRLNTIMEDVKRIPLRLEADLEKISVRVGMALTYDFDFGALAWERNAIR
jgi:prophage antirepressor-like protein